MTAMWAAASSSLHTFLFCCLKTITTHYDGAWIRDCLLIGGKKKQVTKRVDSKDDGEWANWNWRSEGDLMENGAFFVASGEGMSSMYSKASSVDPKASSLVDQLTRNAGVFGGPRDDQGQGGNSYSPYGGGDSGGGAMGDMGDMGGTTRGISSSSDDSNIFGMIFGSDAPPRPRLTLLFSLLTISALSLSTLLLW